MRKLIILGLSCLMFMPIYVFARTLRVDDNTSIKVNISAQEPTRISVAGDRISSLRGVEGAYTVKNDNAQGAIFIKPTEAYQNKPFYVFITTEQNHSYVLQLTPSANAKAGLLVLKPKIADNTTSANGEASSSYETQLTNLVKSMVNGMGSDEYAMTFIRNSKTQHWNKQLNINLLGVFEGAELQGEVYRVSNRSSQPISIDETVFYSEGDHAIALQSYQLPARGQTLLYKVTRHG